MSYNPLDTLNAEGRWHEILIELGVPAKHLTKKNCPCPMCGGRDRFVWTDSDNRGKYNCRGCGGGNGITLLMKFHNWTKERACYEVGLITGTHKPSPFERPTKPAPNKKPSRPLPIERPGELTELKRTPRQAITPYIGGHDVKSTGATGIRKCGLSGSICQVSEWLAKVLPDQKVTNTTRAVAGIISLYWDVPLNIRAIATRFRMSRKTIRKELKTLEQLGYMKITANNQGGREVLTWSREGIPPF